MRLQPGRTKKIDRRDGAGESCASPRHGAGVNWFADRRSLRAPMVCGRSQKETSSTSGQTSSTLARQTAAGALRAPKSISSRRTLDLPQELARELKIWKLNARQARMILSSPRLKESLFTANSQAKYLMQPSTRPKSRLNAYKLRHSFASLLLSRNVPFPKVSRLLGHRDSTITLKVYAHFIEDKKNDAQELADGNLS